jgi:hypothetical protein
VEANICVILVTACWTLKNNQSINHILSYIIGCEEFCLVEKFHSILNDSMPDRKKACGITNPAADSLKSEYKLEMCMKQSTLRMSLKTIWNCCLNAANLKQGRLGL